MPCIKKFLGAALYHSFLSITTLILASAPLLAQPTDTSYHLVFEDEFLGDTLHRDLWHTYINWAGEESDNWGASRADSNLLAIYRDENVRVAGGICTLTLRREDATWHCDTCTQQIWQRRYTTGGLHSYYTNAFSHGYFEARIKMPTARGLHSTFWLWPAEAGKDVPEFDIAEGYGGRLWPTPFATYNDRFVNFSIHRWGPSGHMEKKGRFPNQRYINVLLGNHFRMEDWHVYALEWTPDYMRFFLDGALVKEYSRFYDSKSAAGKNAEPAQRPDGGGAFTPFWFPPPTVGANIRLTLAIDTDIYEQPGTVGELLVDYVRVWQRKED